MLFKDRKGREWDVDIHYGVAMRLKASEGFDFFALEEDKAEGLRSLLEDRFGIMELVWKIIKPQAVAAGVSQDDFHAAMAGESMNQARRAFLESYGNFTQSPAIRSMLKTQLSMEADGEKMMGRAMEKAMEIAKRESSLQAEKISDDNIEKLFSDALIKPQETKAERLTNRRALLETI